MSTISVFQSGLNGIYNGMNALRQDAQVIASANVEDAPKDKSVDEALVGLISDSQQVEASAKVIKAQDEILGTLLNELA